MKICYFKGAKLELILGILFVAIAIIALQLVKKSKTEEAFLKESGKMAQQISELLDKKFDIGLTNAVGFSSRPDVINALSNNDREGAIQALERVSAEYTKQTNYKGIKIHLHDRYGKSFIKNWDTGSFGEDLISSRESVNNVIKDKKATVQFEIGSVGLMIRAISPVFDNELYVGSVEFLQGVGSVSRDLAKKDLIYALVIPNQVAEKYSKLAKNKQVGSFVLANNKWFSDEVVSALGDADMLNLTTNSKFLGKMYYFISIPVKTDSGALIGYHISGIPSQKIYNAIQSQLRLPYMLLGLLIVTIIVPMLFSYSFTKSVIINRIKNVQDKLEIMSKGDFTVKLKPKYNDEIGELAYSVGAMAKDVSSSLYVINEKLSRLSNVSNELTGLSERVSAGVAQQSAAASSSASAIEELNVTVQEVANNASIVADAANRADKLVVDGHTMSVNSMKLMETIAQNVQQNSLIVNNLGQLSQEIGQIIQVINDIADQTNLLALNAAIEAARAGDHGRGFAVVADEVRKLAEKTTEATKDIVNMISTIQNETQTAVVNMTANAEKANEGMTMAEHTKQALEEILESVKAVTVEVNKIAIATEEEATAMDLLNQSVVEIDSIAKENESIANETIKSISELNDSNSEINKAVSQFKYNK